MFEGLALVFGCNNTGKAVEQMGLSGDWVHFAPSYALVSLALSFLY